MLHKSLTLTLILLSPLVGPSAWGAQEHAEWARFLGPRGDNSYDGPALATTWEKQGPPVLWSIEIGPGFGGVAVSAGEVFLLDRVTAEADVLRCLALDDGSDLWEFAYEAPGRLSYRGSRGVPTVTKERVYTIGGFGQVHAIDRGSGEPLWSLDIATTFDAEQPYFGWCQSPIVHKGLVILAAFGEDVGLVALNQDTGAVVWTTPPIGQGHSTPILVQLNGRSQVLFTTARVTNAERGRDQTPRDSLKLAELEQGGFLSSFDPETGEMLWSSYAPACSSPVAPPLRVDDTRIFVTGGYRGGSVLLQITESAGAFKASEIFRHPLGSSVHPAVLWKDHLFLTTTENFNEARSRWKQGGLMCLDLQGKECWRTGADPNLGRGPYLMAGGILVSQDGHTGVLRLFEVSGEGYRVVAEADLFPEEASRNAQTWAPLALVDGRLLIRSQRTLKCVDLRPGS